MSTCETVEDSVYKIKFVSHLSNFHMVLDADIGGHLLVRII